MEVKRCNAYLFKFASEAGVCELRGKKRLKRILGFGASGWLAEADTLPRRKIASYSVNNHNSQVAWKIKCCKLDIHEKSRRSWIAIFLLSDNCLWRGGLPPLPYLCVPAEYRRIIPYEALRTQAEHLSTSQKV